jgi:hypothetical protein
MSVPEYEDIPRLVDPDMVPQRPTVCLAYASWCPHCKSLRPEFEKFAKLAREELPHLQILVVESEDAAMSKFSNNNNITGFPTVMIFIPPSKRWERWADFPQSHPAHDMLASIKRHLARERYTSTVYGGYQPRLGAPIERFLNSRERYAEADDLIKQSMEMHRIGEAARRKTEESARCELAKMDPGCLQVPPSDVCLSRIQNDCPATGNGSRTEYFSSSVKPGGLVNESILQEWMNA